MLWVIVSGAVVKLEVVERMYANLILAALNHSALQCRFSNGRYYLLHHNFHIFRGTIFFGKTSLKLIEKLKKL